MSNQSGPAFVAGATGYTGRGVVAALRAAGRDVVAHIRPGSSSLKACKADFEAQGATVDTTPWEAEAMAATLRRLGPSQVFALLGTTRKRARGAGMGPDEAYDRIDYGLTALLIDAAQACSPPPRFIYLSSLGATTSTSNDYLRARGKVESRLAASGLPYTIARPSFITGADRSESRPGERAAATVADGALKIIGALGGGTFRDRYGSMNGSELGEALVRAALSEETAGSTLDSADLRALLRHPQIS